MTYIFNKTKTSYNLECRRLPPELNVSVVYHQTISLCSSAASSPPAHRRTVPHPVPNKPCAAPRHCAGAPIPPRSPSSPAARLLQSHPRGTVHQRCSSAPRRRPHAQPPPGNESLVRSERQHHGGRPNQKRPSMVELQPHCVTNVAIALCVTTS